MVARYDTIVTVTDSKFVKNNSTIGIFDVSGNRCFFQNNLFRSNNAQYVTILKAFLSNVQWLKCTFKLNSADVNKGSLIGILSANVTLDKCIFRNTSYGVVPSMESTVQEQDNFVQISNCAFINNGLIFNFKHITEINIESSSFHSPMRSVGITINKAKILRIANSSFGSLHPIAFYQLDSFFKVKLYTSNSTFTGQNISIGTNDTDFLQEAMKYDIIKVVPPDSLQKEETAYASSKWGMLGTIGNFCGEML